MLLLLLLLLLLVPSKDDRRHGLLQLGEGVEGKPEGGAHLQAHEEGALHRKYPFSNAGVTLEKIPWGSSAHSL